MGSTEADWHTPDRVVERAYVRHGGARDAVLEEAVALGVPEDVVERRLAAIRAAQVPLQRLLDNPGIPQRTPPWYAARENLVTASDLATALGAGKFQSKKQLIMKKVDPGSVKSNFDSPILRWGQMLEDAACAVYTRKTGVAVHDFGLVPHPTRAYFGASPDGITDLGTMLEIKTPAKRVIDGKVPYQYEVQMQGQMHCCGLGECDYLECGFKQYEDPAAFLEADGRIKGISVELFRIDDPNARYLHSRVLFEDAAAGEARAEYERMGDRAARERAAGGPLNNRVVMHVWFLDRFFLKRIPLDREFVEGALDELGQVWADIVR
jgi:putative phage-type endonuclease